MGRDCCALCAGPCNNAAPAGVPQPRRGAAAPGSAPTATGAITSPDGARSGAKERRTTTTPPTRSMAATPPIPGGKERRDLDAPTMGGPRRPPNPLGRRSIDASTSVDAHKISEKMPRDRFVETQIADAVALGSARGNPGFEYGCVRLAGSATFIVGTLVSSQFVWWAGLGPPRHAETCRLS
jgi:hypothetical protein